MNALENIEEEKIMPKLRLITGGKGPPTATGVNWLKDLKKGAVFTCKRKGMTCELELLIVAFKHDKTIVLVDGLNGAPRRAVDPSEFCKQYDWFETIQEAEQLPEEHDNDTRPVRSSRMDDNADAEGRQPSDDGSGQTEA